MEGLCQFPLIFFHNVAKLKKKYQLQKSLGQEKHKH